MQGLSREQEGDERDLLEEPGAHRRSDPRLPVLRSRVFWGQLLTMGAVLVLTALVIGGLVDRRVRSDLLTTLESELTRESALLVPVASRELAGADGDLLQPELASLRARTGLRITVVRADGTVLADSHHDPGEMDRHDRRPEIVAAKRSPEGVGVSRRRSATLGQELLYVARVVPGTGGGIVRVSLPVSEVEARSNVARRSVVLGTAAGLLLSLVLGVWIARQRARPIAAITRVAEDMRAGSYGSRVFLERKDELGVLADTLNRLGEELTQRIARISREDAQLRAMLSGMVEGVIAVDEDDQVVFCNDAARSLLGIPTRDPVVDRKLWELAPIAELERLLAEAHERGGVARGELELHRTGRERLIDAQAASYRGGGQAGIVAVLHDVSDLRRLERVRRDFVANVSHELKTPLTTIKGFVETLLDGALEDAEHNVRFLQRIEANVDRLASLVTDLLSLARIEAQGGEIPTAPVDWTEVLAEVVRRHEDPARAKELEFRVDLPELRVIVRGDREAMTQVVDNLIDNAIKYTPGQGQVTVMLEARDGYGVLSVQDTGVGIPQEDVDRVFERFYRVDKARSRDVGGTGLGLSIVKNLVLSMEGDVQVESRLGSGSRFVVCLPLAT